MRISLAWTGLSVHIDNELQVSFALESLIHTQPVGVSSYSLTMSFSSSLLRMIYIVYKNNWQRCSHKASQTSHGSLNSHFLICWLWLNVHFQLCESDQISVTLHFFSFHLWCNEHYTFVLVTLDKTLGHFSILIIFSVY